MSAENADSGCRPGNLSWPTWDPRERFTLALQRLWRRKIVANLRALEAKRFDLKFGMPGLSQEAVMTHVELYGNQVIPRVRELWAVRGPEPSSVGRGIR